jgi:hypothetical protein
MIEEKIRQKIQKLFAMAQGSFGNEAEIALKKAHEFMSVYGIAPEDIEIFSKDMPYGKRIQWWTHSLHDLCSWFCGVVSLLSRQDHRLIFEGDEIGINVAYELFRYLEKEIERKTAASSIHGKRAKNDFRFGLVVGLNKKMQMCGGWRDMVKKRNALVEKHFANVRVFDRIPRMVSTRDYVELGIESAKEISLARQAGHVGAGGFLGKRVEEDVE